MDTSTNEMQSLVASVLEMSKEQVLGLPVLLEWGQQQQEEEPSSLYAFQK